MRQEECFSRAWPAPEAIDYKSRRAGEDTATDVHGWSIMRALRML